MEIKLDWTNFKTEVYNRKTLPQWIDGNGSYYIKSKDDFFKFSCELIQDGGADVTDFETNYKNNWNKKLDYRNTEGLQRLIQSPRPDGTKTYFTGAGDSGGLASGNRLMFNMLSADANKSVNLAMSEDVYAYRGTVQYVNAPFGAYIDFSIIIPPSTVLANYVTKVPLFGTGVINFASQDVELIPLGAQIKATVTNSDGIGGYDAAADFKVATFIELYRSTLL